MKVLVGMSGGVDSTVTAILLKEAGYDVIGATMAIWGDRNVKGIAQEHKKKNACFGPDEKEDIESAKKVAAEIGVPYHVFNCAKEYDEVVLKYFKSEYLKGKTPNPCVYCNALIKFGVLPHIARMNGVTFDKFATGHYAKVEEQNGRYVLKRGINPHKDQSYFLYKLTQEQLANIILPLGNYNKEQIRDIAQKHGLSVADKHDSQDFYCGDYNELLEVENKKGNIVDTNGKILGEHEGIWNYTIGQRKGLGISSTEPLYVLSLNKDTNEVVVGFKDKTFKKSLTAVDINFVSYDKLPTDRQLSAKIRSTQQPQNVCAQFKNNKLIVEFDEWQKSIAPGQSVVIYDDDIVVAGGIIDTVE